jgi:GTP-binding protein LepA
MYDLPLSEMVFDFYDQLKSITKGYASMDYEFKVISSIKVSKARYPIKWRKVDALSLITHDSNSYYKGRDLVGKLRKIIDRQQFDIAIQAAVGSKIIARETVKALRKNVFAKCYGGDVSRKRKL